MELLLLFSALASSLSDPIGKSDLIEKLPHPFSSFLGFKSE